MQIGSYIINTSIAECIEWLCYGAMFLAPIGWVYYEIRKDSHLNHNN